MKLPINRHFDCMKKCQSKTARCDLSGICEKLPFAAPQDSGRTGEQLIPVPIDPVVAAPRNAVPQDDDGLALHIEEGGKYRPKRYFPPLDYSKQQANTTQKEYDEALRDALRYRFIRKEQSYREGAVFVLRALGHRIEDFDTFIDEVMKKSTN